MVGGIGVTALTLLAIRPNEENVNSLVELCNNRIDMEAITVLRKELQYFQYLLANLKYDYQTVNEDGEYVPSRELNRYSKQLALGNKSREERQALEEKFEEAKRRIPHVKVVSGQQDVAGRKVTLGALERQILGYYVENAALIPAYLRVLNKGDVIHDVGLVFRQKLYRLPRQKPVALYYRISEMLRGKKNMSAADLEEIRSSAMAIKFRFEDPVKAMKVDAGEALVTEDVCTKFGVETELQPGRDESILGLARELSGRLEGVGNCNKHLMAIMELSRDVYWFCNEARLLSAIFCGGEQHSLGEFEEAFRNLDKAGFFGLSLQGMQLFLDSMGALSLIPDMDIKFSRKPTDFSTGYGRVIDTILAFCRCNEVAIMEEIKEDMA